MSKKTPGAGFRSSWEQGGHGPAAGSVLCPGCFQASTQASRRGFSPDAMLGLLVCWGPGSRLLRRGEVRLTFALRGAWLLLFLVVVLKRCQPQHFAILVTLVQRFELIDEGHGTIAFKSFVPVSLGGRKHNF